MPTASGSSRNPLTFRSARAISSGAGQAECDPDLLGRNQAANTLGGVRRPQRLPDGGRRGSRPTSAGQPGDAFHYLEGHQAMQAFATRSKRGSTSTSTWAPQADGFSTESRPEKYGYTPVQIGNSRTTKGGGTARRLQHESVNRTMASYGGCVGHRERTDCRVTISHLGRRRDALLDADERS